jgi:hypothetical protein
MSSIDHRSTRYPAYNTRRRLPPIGAVPIPKYDDSILYGVRRFFYLSDPSIYSETFVGIVAISGLHHPRLPLWVTYNSFAKLQLKDPSNEVEGHKQQKLTLRLVT